MIMDKSDYGGRDSGVLQGNLLVQSLSKKTAEMQAKISGVEASLMVHILKRDAINSA
jgi:hypothetical protein